MTPAQQRIARRARARNFLFLLCRFPHRVPECERDGVTDRVARLAYLAGLDVAFTRSDRSMVLRHGLFWWAVADDQFLSDRPFRTRDAALSACRAAEKQHDELERRATSARITTSSDIGARGRWLRSMR